MMKKLSATLLAVSLVLWPQMAMAGSLVDQGMPGNQGSWKITLASGPGTSVTNPIFVDTSGSGSTVTATTVAGVALTGTSPSSGTDGADVTSGSAVRISLDSGVGNTINQQGGLKGWQYINSTWRRTPDLDVSIIEAGNRYYAYADVPIRVPSGRVAWTPNNMALTGGGTTVTLYYEVSK